MAASGWAGERGGLGRGPGWERLGSGPWSSLPARVCSGILSRDISEGMGGGERLPDPSTRRRPPASAPNPSLCPEQALGPHEPPESSLQSPVVEMSHPF